MLGVEFSLRLCLGFPLAAFQADTTNTSYSAYEVMGPLLLCCDMMMPRIKDPLREQASTDRAAIRTRPRSGAVLGRREAGPTG